MKTRYLLNSLAVTAVFALGTAHASTMTADELFDFLQSGDVSSIESTETVEFSRLEFNDTKQEYSTEHEQEPLSKVFDLFASD